MNQIVLMLSMLMVVCVETSVARGVLTPPPDSAEAQRVRIWVPVTNQNLCRLTITILDDSGIVVRTLFNQMADPGYYNFYWDKKDDSGSFVEPGQYEYFVDNCTVPDSGTVLAQYKDWERLFNFSLPEKNGPANFVLEVLQDSAVVSVIMQNRRGLVVDTVVMDSIMNKGEWSFEWRPDNRVPRGRYKVRIRVGDFDDIYEFLYVPGR